MSNDPTACGHCYGYGREPSEGSRCQDCGGNGLAPGSTGYHPRAFSIRLGTICNGWQAADFHQLTKLVESAAAWTKEAGFKLQDFTDVDRRKIRMMIERQVVLGIDAGHFEDIGIPRGSRLAVQGDLDDMSDVDLFSGGRPII